MTHTTVPISKIHPPKFGLPDNPEKDEKLMELLHKDHNYEINQSKAIVCIDLIKPFCAFIPEKVELDRHRVHFLKQMEDKDPPLILLYQDGDKFIMSDDYFAYHTYKNEGFKHIPALILGEVTLPVSLIGTTM